MKFRRHFLVVLFLVLGLFACALPGMDMLNPQSEIETRVAATLEALPTHTPQPTATVFLSPTMTRVPATSAATQTPQPTLTNMPTWTDTPTRTVVPTMTPSLDGPEVGRKQGDTNFACVVLSRSPSGIFQASPRQDISVTWRIQNVGAREWRTDGIDYGYVSGQKMSIGGALFDLSTTIPAGAVGDITVRFESPEKPGSYTTTWALYRGRTPFCKFSFSLVVK